MGQDYSYSQPSSSDGYDITSLLEEEAALYADDADSTQIIVEPFEYPPQPEADDGIPRRCYCGAEPSLATSYTSIDPGRRYYTCENAEDGDCHVWKWMDVAVLEEMNDFQRQLGHVKDQCDESEQKLANLEEAVSELAKKQSRVGAVVALVVCVLITVFLVVCLVEDLHRMKRLWSDQ